MPDPFEPGDIPDPEDPGLLRRLLRRFGLEVGLGLVVLSIVGEVLGWWNDLGLVVGLGGLVVSLAALFDVSGSAIMSRFDGLYLNQRNVLRSQSGMLDNQESMLDNQESMIEVHKRVATVQERILDRQDRSVEALDSIQQILDERLPRRG